MTAKPPGPLREYVRSNCFLSSLTVSGYDVDREKLLLANVLVRNYTLSTLRVLNVFGGGTSVRFTTRVLAECSSREKLYVGSVQNAYTMIPEASLTRGVDDLAHNQTLEEPALPYELWNANDWIAFFAMLRRNKCMKQLYVKHRYPDDCMTLLSVLEALALSKQYTASAFEKVARSPALVRELAQKTGVAVTEVTGALRSRLRSVDGLHDFMRLTGVVKECVTCAPLVGGCGMQLHDLNDDCWRLVKSYLSFDDVKRIAIASPFHVSLGITH
ncbi:hypothetical protein HPB51_020134 [Rhipicephalus microplus]|uniref:Uncharacterized protein n=1 Tax=Rhipicephalus microplus TaxID=6941 RepID=A0A9J6EJ08_RHIMP|nr:hypothetical protein HPB51_020134 [Rhipicephalus microplus]